MNIESTIKDRAKKYGDFKDYALTENLLNRIIKDGLPEVQAAALRMIFCKISRIVTGDPNYIDNWHDIAGYAQIVERHLKGEKI